MSVDTGTPSGGAGVAPASDVRPPFDSSLTPPYEASAVFSPEATSLGSLTIEDDVALETGERLMTLNMGPQHPSTHGVLRVVLKLDGELIIDCDPIIGYLHRGTEKLGEHHRYAQVIPWTDRTDYVAAPMNNLGCALAFEKLCGVEAPERAQYWRVIMSELAADRLPSASGSARMLSISAPSRCRSTASASGS